MALPSAVSAQGFGSFACAPGPDDVDAAVDGHLALRPQLLHDIGAARHVYREHSLTLRAVSRGERTLSPEEHAALVVAQGEARAEVQRLHQVHVEWAACYDELAHLRRFYPRAVHHLRLSLGFDGSLWRMRNQAEDLVAEYPDVWFRAPSAALELGWERFYTRRFGVQVSGMLAVGQGRMRACGVEELPSCYGDPPAGGMFTAGVDVGFRVWVVSIFTIGLSLELRVTRLPVTERIQNGNRYGVSDQVVPAALLRLAPEFLMSRDGRWWVAPSVGYGRMLTQRGGVTAASVQLGYSL